jgi:plastocyanin
MDESGFVAHTQRRETRTKMWPFLAKGVGRVTLQHNGEVDYFCRFHPNMTGRISVAAQ